ncbi:MAG: FAD-dependent oxidoreductase [Burkholderiaceae bacterium]|nr:FAD-dependent oxidoreductase [Burkholderiaceae bacterium]
MREEPIVILGGGIAGLAASMACGAPVFEAGSQPGGVAASDAADGFVFDRGIHILQSRHKRALELFDHLGVQFSAHKRRAFIHSHGKYTPYPFQVNTAGLPLALRARCVWGFVRRHHEPEPRNYEEWMYRSLGRGFAQTFLIPYSEKFWTVHPREMSFEWTGGRVPQPRLSQVLRGALWSRQTRIGTNAEFRYPEPGAGYGAVARRLAEHAGPVHLGCRATRIDVRRRIVEFDGAPPLRYQDLISSIALPELVALCPDAPEEVVAAARRLRSNSILVVNLGINAPAIRDMHWVHFPEPDVAFFRISYPHNFAHDVAPPGLSSISAEVAYSEQRPLDRATIVDRVIADLVRVGALDRADQVISRQVHDVRRAYCIYDMQRHDSVRTVHHWLREVGILPTGRYGLWTYFWSDQAMLSGRGAGLRVLRERAERDGAALGQQAA